jgi:hypothetical protein
VCPSTGPSAGSVRSPSVNAPVEPAGTVTVSGSCSSIPAGGAAGPAGPAGPGSGPSPPASPALAESGAQSNELASGSAAGGRIAGALACWSFGSVEAAPTDRAVSAAARAGWDVAADPAPATTKTMAPAMVRAARDAAASSRPPDISGLRGAGKLPVGAVSEPGSEERSVVIGGSPGAHRKRAPDDSRSTLLTDPEHLVISGTTAIDVRTLRIRYPMKRLADAATQWTPGAPWACRW